MMDITTKFNEEMSKVTNMLSFLITQPQLATTLTEVETEQIQSMNLLRVKAAKMWADAMVKEVESKCKQETIDNMNKLFECIEVGI